MILPLALPGIVAGSIFTFSLTLGDYITPVLSAAPSSQFIGNVVYDSVNGAGQPPVRRRVRSRAAARDGRLPADRAPARRVRGALMESRGTRIGLGVWVVLVLAFLYIPIVDHLPLRVQLVERPELADRRA